MVPHTLRELFWRTQVRLCNDRLTLTSIQAEKHRREGSSRVLAADLLAEQYLVPELCAFWPGLPVLCEEAEHSGLARLAPGISVLPHSDDVVTLPQDLISVDGLDGSALYANGELSLVGMSAGQIMDGLPRGGVVMMLHDRMLYYTGVEGVFCDGDLHRTWCEPRRPLNQSLIGLDDNKAVDTQFRQLVFNTLAGSSGTRYPLNVPSVAGGLKVLQGNLVAYVTSTARHWDIAGTAALCASAGMVVRCLDGSPVPWNQVRMPPVVFARDEEAFSYVHEQAAEYLKTQRDQREKAANVMFNIS